MTNEEALEHVGHLADQMAMLASRMQRKMRVGALDTPIPQLFSVGGGAAMRLWIKTS
jgi:hypothetical protein